MTVAHEIWTPSIVIAGAPRCGSTALFDHISTEYAVRPSTPKETRHLLDRSYYLFDEDMALASYASFFSDRGDLPTMEATPDYMYQESALAALCAGSAHVVFVLREPVARVLSVFRFVKYQMNRMPFRLTADEFASALCEGQSLGRPMLDMALDQSRYEVHLQSWLANVPAYRLHIVGTRAVSSPTERASLAQSLDLLPDPQAKPVVRRNSSSALRWPKVYGVARRVGGRAPKRVRAWGQATLQRVIRQEWDEADHFSVAAEARLRGRLTDTYSWMYSQYPEVASSW